MKWELAWDTTDARRVSLDARPLYLGRGPANDVVVGDATVSTRHAAVWADDNSAWVEDLKSRNGTWVNGRAVTGTVALSSGDRLRLGTTATWVVRIAQRRHAGGATGWMVVDVEKDLALPIRSSRFRLGADDAADVHIAGVEEVVLLMDSDGVWLRREGDHQLLADGQAFDVGPHRFELRHAPAVTAPTQEAHDAAMPYILETRLGGDAPMARVVDRVSGARVEITAATQVALLWQLAQAVVRDQSNGVLADERGWCEGRDLRVGVWGREAAEAEERLNLLVFRVRKQLKEGGLDGAVIERKRGRVRAYVREAAML